MKLDKIVLYIVAAIAAFFALFYLAAIALGSLSLGPYGLLLALPAAVVAYIFYRVIVERLGDREDDHYDRIER